MPSKTNGTFIKYSLLINILISACSLFAQVTVSGRIVSASNHTLLAGAKVKLTHISNEKARRSYLKKLTFVKGKSEYFPLPQTEID